MLGAEWDMFDSCSFGGGTVPLLLFELYTVMNSHLEESHSEQ